MTKIVPIEHQPERSEYSHEIFYPIVEKMAEMAEHYTILLTDLNHDKKLDWYVSIWQNLGKDPVTNNTIQARLRRRKLYVAPAPTSIWVDTRIKDSSGRAQSTPPEEAAFFWTNGTLSSIKIRQYYGGLPHMERLSLNNLDEYLPIVNMVVKRLEQAFPVV